MKKSVLIKRLTFIRVLFLFFLTSVGVIAEVRPYQIVNYSKDTYKAGSQNWNIAFDSDGYIYVGNSHGLLEYDGVNWRLFNSPNNVVVRAVAVDKSNRVYTGGYRELGYWERDETGRLQYTSFTSMVQHYFSINEEFWNIIVVQGMVCFHSFSGIYIYENGEFRVHRDLGFINFITSSQDDIFCSIKNVGIYRVTKDRLIPLTESPFLVNKNIRFIARMDSKNFLIGTEFNGIYLYSIENNKFSDFAIGMKDYLRHNKINHGFIAPNGQVILGTIVDGLVILDRNGQLLHKINKNSGLQNNTVLDLAMDQTGNFWLALDNGIDFISFSDSKSNTYVKLDEVGAIYSAAVYNNNLYLGTNQGLFLRPQNEINGSFTLVPGTQDQVWNCNLIDNKLFVGHNSGTFVFNGHRMSKISNRAGGYSIIECPKNPDLLLQCTYSNIVVYKKQNGLWRFSHAIKGFNNLIRFIEFDPFGNLWASHLYQGLYKLRINDEMDSVISMEHFGENSVLGINGHSANVFKIEDRIVFTGFDGLYTYDDLNDTIVLFRALNKELGQYAMADRIVAGPNHRYWFINHLGIACFDIIGNSVTKVKEFPVTLFNNQLIPKYENIVPLDKETALVCMEDGYTILRTQYKEEGSEIEKLEVKLREMKVFSKSGDEASYRVTEKLIQLPFNRNSIFFRFSFPVISAEKLHYSYKVVGLSDDWSDLMEKPEFSLNRIPPGEYTLMVKAINSWGKASKDYEKRIIINRPFYQSLYAVLFYFVIIGLLLYFTRYMTVKRVRMYEKRKRDENERELVQLRNEKLRTELSFKSEQLANSTMGIIKKNELLLSLKRKLKRQKEHLGSRFPDKFYKDLVDKIDLSISGHDDWKIFEHNFEKAHETFLKTLKTNYPQLTPGDLRLCAYLKLNLSSKEIAPLLGVSVRGVENHRYRLRKKFGLNKEANLTEFILAM